MINDQEDIYQNSYFNRTLSDSSNLLSENFMLFFSELCYGKTMVAYTKPQQWKREENERLRGEGDQTKLISLRFERWQVAGFRKARRRQDAS